MAGPRVAYILLWFPEPSQTFILDEVNTLVRLGLDLTVYTLYGHRSSHLIAGMGPVAAPVIPLGAPALGALIKDLLKLGGRWPGGRRFLKRVLIRRWRSLETAGEALWATLAGVSLARKFQASGIDHIHAPWADGPATAAWVASQLSGIPFSFCAHAHDIYPPDGALREKLEAASLVRVISESNRRHLSALAPGTEAKMVTIHYGSPLRPRPASPRPGRAPFQLLAMGRLVPKKGCPVLMQACRDLMARGVDFHLTLAGDGPQYSMLSSLVQRYGLKDRVTLTGFVPHRQVPALFHQADLFIMPCVIDRRGDRDGLPNVILEAMAHEVPVIATPVNGIPEAIHPGRTGWLVPPEDAPALAQAVLEALGDPAEARRRAKAGWNLVGREFDSQKNYGQLKICFQRLAQGEIGPGLGGGLGT